MLIVNDHAYPSPVQALSHCNIPGGVRKDRNRVNACISLRFMVNEHMMCVYLQARQDKWLMGVNDI